MKTKRIENLYEQIRKLEDIVLISDDIKLKLEMSDFTPEELMFISDKHDVLLHLPEHFLPFYRVYIDSGPINVMIKSKTYKVNTSYEIDS